MWEIEEAGKKDKEKEKKVRREDPVFPYQQENNILKIFQDLDQRPYHVEYTRSHQLTLSYDEPHQYMEGWPQRNLVYFWHNNADFRRCLDSASTFRHRKIYSWKYDI